MASKIFIQTDFAFNNTLMSDDLLTILYDPRSISEKCRLISMHGNGRNTTKFETIQIPDHHV